MSSCKLWTLLWLVRTAAVSVMLFLSMDSSEWRLEFSDASSFTIPFLVLHGECDGLVLPEGSRCPHECRNCYLPHGTTFVCMRVCMHRLTLGGSLMLSLFVTSKSGSGHDPTWLSS
jgi:hypothetical protein